MCLITPLLKKLLMAPYYLQSKFQTWILSIVFSYSIRADSFVIPPLHEFLTPAWLDHSPCPEHAWHLAFAVHAFVHASIQSSQTIPRLLKSDLISLRPSNIFKSPALIPHPGILSLSSEGLQLYRNYSGGVVYCNIQFKELLDCKLLQDGDELFHLLILRMPCCQSLWTCCCLITIHWPN